MNLLTAIEKVLSDSKKPLHTSEICQLVISKKLWNTRGKTPEATVGARIYSDIKNNGKLSKFVKVAPRTFFLRNNVTEELASHQINNTDRVVDGKRMGFSFTDCAQKVLEEFGNKKPMHYKDITKIAIDKSWLYTEGKKPEATMNAMVINEIKRKKNRGEVPRFVQHGGGFLGLNQWEGHGLVFQINQHNKKIRKGLLEHLRNKLSWQDFEKLVELLCVKMGFEDAKPTPNYNDRGIDIRGTLVVSDVIRIQMAVQVKKWKNNIQSPIVQQVRGSLGATEHGLIITTSDFSAGAKREAQEIEKKTIALMNGDKLVSLLMEHEIGVKRSTSPDVFEIDVQSIIEGTLE